MGPPSLPGLPSLVCRTFCVLDNTIQQVRMPRITLLPQGNRILIFESILIYQHSHPKSLTPHPEPPTPHPEPVEGAPPLLLLDNSTSPSQSPFIKASFLALDHPLIYLSRWKTSSLVENWSRNTNSTGVATECSLLLLPFHGLLAGVPGRWCALHNRSRRDRGAGKRGKPKWGQSCPIHRPVQPPDGSVLRQAQDDGWGAQSFDRLRMMVGGHSPSTGSG